MPFSSGTFTRTFDCTTDRDNGVKILASKFDTEFDGIATGLSTCILKDGTQTCTAAIPFAEGLTVPDNKTIVLGTNSDITIQYDETTNDALEIAANVEGAALGVVLKADQGDDNADQHKLNIADGGVLTLQSKISGGFVTYLTHTPNATVTSSTTTVAGNLTVAGEVDGASLDISGDADIDGTLEADAMTLNGTAITATATLDTGISNNNVPKFTSGVADDDFLRVDGTAIEGRSASEVLSDIAAMPLAGGAFSGDVTFTGDSHNIVFDKSDDALEFADNAKATFGTGSDLTITHDGSDSLITDSGTGNLQIRADDFYVMKQDGSEVMIRADTDSFVKLFHDGSERLATTSTGIDVTGTSKSDLVVVDNSGGATPTYSHTNNGEGITLRYNDDSGARAADIVATGNTPAGATMAMRFFVNPASTDAASEVMRLQNDKVAIGTGTAVGTLTTECSAGDSNFALTAYHPTSTSARNIAKFQSNVGSTQADVVTIGCDGGIEAVGEITTTNSLSQSSNSIRTVIGNDGGSATFGTSTNHQVKLFTNNTQRGVLDSDGKFLIGATSYSNTSNVSGAQLAPDSPNVLGVNADLVLLLNRRTNDGNLISFQQDKSEEGSISVSGTTVSYNGGHLSRWSQATDGNRIDGLVKGTVMTNLDQMAVWHHKAKEATFYEDGDDLMITPDIFYKEGDTIPEGKEIGDLKTAAVYAEIGDEKTPAVDAYTEDNEQLNCMAVSSVEGDVNVAGVFVNWDDDDKDFTADMNVAMTGDMVIRIAKDTTVARGDLLMSAGDGTAKPQGDDIVRSKTIAKVTSTTKSHTYDDGSYLVPCVLMAC